MTNNVSIVAFVPNFDEFTDIGVVDVAMFPQLSFWNINNDDDDIM